MDTKSMNKEQFLQFLDDECENGAVRSEFLNLVHERLNKADTLDNDKKYIDGYKVGLFDAVGMFIKAQSKVRS